MRFNSADITWVLAYTALALSAANKIAFSHREMSGSRSVGDIAVKTYLNQGHLVWTSAVNQVVLGGSPAAKGHRRSTFDIDWTQLWHQFLTKIIGTADLPVIPIRIARSKNLTMGLRVSDHKGR